MTCHALLEALRQPGFYPEPTQHVATRETHASLVFLTDQYAYKVKKSVNFGFLDYSTLERRRVLCREELLLNRRLAAAVYIDVLAIRRTPQGYSFQGEGPIVEYALKMRRLPDQASLEALLVHDVVTVQSINALARRLAAFHTASALPQAAPGYGTLRQVNADWQESMAQTLPYIGTTISRQDYVQLQQAVSTFTTRHAAWFAQRVQEGHIRDCHGDLRAEHIYLLDGEIYIIDCIEFSPQLRFIDVASEIAFLAMDLERLGCAAVAGHFVRAYVAATEDITLYRLLDFYRCYRACVRGKVTSLRLQSTRSEPERSKVQQTAAQAFLLAARYARRAVRPVCILTTGLVGSGKSTLAEGVARALDARLFSSDRLRKEQAGLAPETRQHVAYGSGIYNAATTQQTYETLINRASQSLSQGYSVVLDASFARRSARLRLATLARDLGAACYLLECYAPEAVLLQRLEQRARLETSISDGRAEILQQFQQTYEPVQPDEPLWHVRLDTSQGTTQCVQQALAALDAGHDGSDTNRLA